MDKPTFRFLIEKHLTDSLNSQELASLKVLLEDEQNKQLLDSIMNEQLEVSEITEDDYTGVVDSIRQRILSHISDERHETKFIRSAHRIHFLKAAWFRNVAAILLILSVAAYFVIAKWNKEKPIIVQEHNKQPGRDKAILTLSDGRQIILDNSERENISDGNISIEKSNGVLTYNAALTSDAAGVSYNTMNTPRGGQYQLVLPDGSKVWLNSASYLKYPTIFQGKKRTVELSGEAYFDIKENKKMPFVVKTQMGEVLVLGTEFNINSYSDEPSFSTTLVSGSVKVSAGKDVKTILPGQQVTLVNSNPDVLTINKNVDINQVVAWQKGIFAFKGANLDIIARQLSRWYDVEVIVGVDSKKINFSGGITKKTPLKTVLKVLSANGVRYKWENDVITLYSDTMN